MENTDSILTKNTSIIVTGAAGFIGSCMVQYLNEQGYGNLILVDDFGVEEKRKNWESKRFANIVERYNLFDWLHLHQPKIDFVIHLGARTDTTEFDYAVHEELNVEYSQDVWNYCTAYQVPLIYASSAATYGGGEFGYDDNHEVIEKLQPLNPYGISKNEFDKWALQQHNAPPFWTGLKFFNVYGPNEYHKGRMASVIFHTFRQIKQTGGMKLFKSHKSEYADGHQSRDFIYVKDVLDIILFFMKNQSADSGIYNFGTGQARTFLDLTQSTFKALNLDPNIMYIDTPIDIRDTYQYFTEAKMDKLRAAGYDKSLWSLEDGVNDYVTHYLNKAKYY